MSYLDAQGRYVEEQGYPDPAAFAEEAATLLAFLERQRATFARKAGGLDEAGLRATLGSSHITLGGMLKHLARFEDDMSSEWISGQGQVPRWSDVGWNADRDWDWRTAAEDRTDELYALW